jgi:predicted  nucleic acid-binding Zn-ribbon protein
LPCDKTGETLHPDLQTVIDLQDVDRRIGELTSRIDFIPTQVKKIEDQLNEFLHAYDEHKRQLAANQKARRDFEVEIQTINGKISKHRDQLYEMKSNEAYKTMLHEIGGEEAKIRSIEDRILEKMVESEQLEQYVKDASARLDSERSRVAEEKKQLKAERDRDLSERVEAEGRRRALASSLGDTTLRVYERTRKSRGTVVVQVVDGSCSGCHVKLRPQYYNEVRGSDSLMVCENCGRILHYVESPVDKAAEGTRVVM